MTPLAILEALARCGVLEAIAELVARTGSAPQPRSDLGGD